MPKISDNKLIYISLKEASEACDYSQEYLSLRARQGKLKSVKFGKNWITTEEWLAEYIKKSQEYKKVHSRGDQKDINPDKLNLPVQPLVPVATKAIETPKIKVIKIPKNLPVKKEQGFRSGFAVAFMATLFLAVIFFSQKAFLNNSFNYTASLTQEILSDINRPATNDTSKLFTADIKDKFKEYINLLVSTAKAQLVNIKMHILFLTNFLNDKLLEQNKKEASFILNLDEKNELIRKKFINLFFR